MTCEEVGRLNLSSSHSPLIVNIIRQYEKQIYPFLESLKNCFASFKNFNPSTVLTVDTFDNVCKYF